MSRLLRPFLIALLLAVAPASFAETFYQVELIVFRQANPVNANQATPENWAANTSPLPEQSLRSSALTDMATKLETQMGYKVLLHQAWKQAVGSQAGVRFGTGQVSDGHQPVEGTLTLSQGRNLELNLSTWVNRFDSNGFLASSEKLLQQRRFLPDQLIYIDHPSLGALLRVRSL